jgi:hypothetical protein
MTIRSPLEHPFYALQHAGEACNFCLIGHPSKVTRMDHRRRAQPKQRMALQLLQSQM